MNPGRFNPPSEIHSKTLLFNSPLPVTQILEVRSFLILLLDPGVCLILDPSTQKTVVLSKDESKVGYIHYDSSQNLLIFLFKSFGKIGGEMILLDPETEFLGKIVKMRKVIFLEPMAEFIEFSPNPLGFFVKFERDIKVYNLEGKVFNIALNPLKFYHFKHSAELLILFDKPSRIHKQTLGFRVYNRVGSYLNSFDLMLQGNQAIEILDVFGFHLIFKQFHGELLILSLLDGESNATKGFVTPKCIEYMKNCKGMTLILCFYAFGVQIWGIHGGKLKEIRFTLPNESFFFIERKNRLLVLMKKVEGRRKSIRCIDLDNYSDFSNSVEDIDVATNFGVEVIYVAESGNIYLLSEDECVVETNVLKPQRNVKHY